MTTQESRTGSAQVRTVCSYCGVGCGIVLRRRSRRRRPPHGAQGVRRQGAPGQRRAAVHEGRDERRHARRAGPAGDRAASAPSAAPSPAPLGVDAAITRDGAGGCGRSSTSTARTRVALYVSGQMTIEAQYLANKLAKGFIGTNQIESNSRLCMASAGSGYKLSLGADGPPGSYEDFDHADVFFVIGSNMADCHPILFLRMMDRVKAGAKLIVVDPRRTATADKADLFLQITPGTDLALLNGLLHLLVEDGHIDARVHRRAHRGLGGDAGVPRRLPARDGRRDHRHPGGRHPPGRGAGSARPASG